MATSSKGYALTGVLAGGRRRSNNPLVKQAPNNAGPVVVSDTLFSTPVSGAYTLTAQGGAYSVSGGTAGLRRSKYINASGGSYSLTGQQATITWTAGVVNYTFTLLGGSYALTGSNANVSRNRKLTSTGGSYSLSGASAVLRKTKRLVGSGGVYTITGQQAIINRNRLLTATSGLYSLTGSSAILTKSSAGGYPAETDVRLGVVYGASGEYTGTLDVGKKFRLDIATGNVVMVLDGGKVMTL